ncbi:tetratricopeptide repeat protein [Streptomyces sp. NPDC019890]|uniref:tetratricopeptide repeat protein n=1 Tax=Streptomyces sp. NPDC019890 TaxID=3365064 RepID=UPI00384B3D75
MPHSVVQASNGAVATRHLHADNIYLNGARPDPLNVPVTVAPPLGLRAPQHPLRGRDALLEQVESALSTPGDWRAHVLAGMGGCGKTSMALELAYRRMRMGHEVWWVDARQATTLQSGLRAVARHIGAADEQLRAGDVADVLWARLSQYGRPWLLVVDNADDPALLDGPGQLRSGTGWVRPHTNSFGGVLVTTRDSTAGTWGSGCALHPVRTLTGDDIGDAAQILLDHVPARAGTADDARRLAERLGGLPLALILAGTYLAEVNDRPSAYRDPDMPADFASYQTALDNGLRHVDPGNVISQTWAMSVDLLTKRGEPLARPLLELIATFADAPLPYTLLLTPDRLANAGQLGDLDGPGLWRLLTALAGLGLIDLSPTTTGSGSLATVRVHPLVRDASRSDTALSTAVSAMHSAAFADETGVPEEPAYWDHWRLLQPHASDLFHRATAASLPDDVMQDAASAGGLAARQLLARGLYQQARTEFETVLAIERETLGDTHPETLFTRHELARALHAQGELAQARTEFETVLAIERETLGDTHPETLVTRHNLAAVLHDQGELTQARTEYEAILAIERETLGDTHPHTLSTRHELARTLHDQGELTQARTEFEAILAIRHETLGDTHPHTLITRRNLARTLHDQGELTQARTEFETVLAIQRETLGDTHPHTLLTRHNLARTLHDQGELAQPRTEFEAILAIQRETLGDTHPHTEATRAWLASL